MGLFSKIAAGLKKTKDALSSKLKYVFTKNEIDQDFYDELEMVLISSDVGVEVTDDIISKLKAEVKKNGYKKTEETKNAVKQILVDILNQNEKPELKFPLVLMVIGVNGVGKTTSIGKLANKFAKEGKNVVICAGDTFRAAASDQLSVWADRAKVKIVKSETGSDPGAVVFDSIKSAKAKNADVLIIDTAGRLHNKVNLMEELKKINRIVEREYPEAMYLKAIVVDSSIGMNSISQVEAFGDAVGLTDIIITKLDGTSKGGAVFALASSHDLAIRYVGVGEGVDDLIDFDAKAFVDSIIE